MPRPPSSPSKFRTILLSAAVLVTAVAGFSLATPVLAQAPDIGVEYAQAIGLGTQDVRTTASTIIRAFMGALGLIAVGIILYAGFLWMTAGGDAEKVKKAQQTMGYAVLGLVVIFSSYAIARFVFGALGADVGSGPSNGCVPGQVCGDDNGGGGLGGSAGGFRVESVSPVGSGPQRRGWPKNAAVTVTFSSPVAAASVTSSSVEVRRCNNFGLIGDINDFEENGCSEVIAGSLDVDGRRVTFRPSAAEGEEAMFEPGSWYRVRVLGAAVRDTSGRSVVCPFRPQGAEGDISSPQARRDLCERAMAFADILDVEAPEATVAAPTSPPGYCAALIPVQVNASDDFLVADVELRLDGGTEGLVDATGAPLTTMQNVSQDNPFAGAGVFVDSTFASDGLSHEITAVPRDASGKVGSVARATFKANAPHCCNAVQDNDRQETGVDCGVNSGCGACGGGSCTEDSQCQSGFCSPTGNVCEERPVIDSISPVQAGVGSIVTVSGRFFGAAEGRVVFLGADTDGNGDPKGDADDVDAASCAQGSWTATQVAVVVPANAVTGPIELRTAAGKFDRTDVVPGFAGNFTVGGATKPGICVLEPFSGPVGSGLVIRGLGFGNDKGQSTALFGGRELSIGQGGWSDTQITTLVPNVREGGYGVNVRLGAGAESNLATYAVTPSASAVRPRITAVLPASGPAGGSFTIQGTGFGTAKGRVRLFFGNGTSAEIADAVEPACNETWHDTYVVVKVPERYRSGNAVNSSAAGVVHKVELETAGGFRTAQVDFSVNQDAVRPTVCAIVPDNGPAGRSVEIIGEGFGNGPGSPSDEPKFAAEFFKAAGVTVPATTYGGWTTTKVITAVPGVSTDRSTWPASGPVRLKAAGIESANAVPFTVQNCTDRGVSCPAGTQCCAQSGSCAESCAPVDRSSGYGWQLSTDVLPSIPRVVERASCDKDGRLPQSPSPANGSQDACGNAAVVVEFNRVMRHDLISPSTVGVVECGSNEVADCADGQQVTLDGNFAFADGTGTVVTFGPAGSHNGGIWKANTWYQVTLASDPSGRGIQDVAGKYLDGDKDNAEGGDYVWAFRTSPTGGACGVDYVTVAPGKATIRQQGGDLGSAASFISLLTSANCNALRCVGATTYDIAWSTDSEENLDLLAPGVANQCAGALQPVLGLKETDPKSPAHLVADVSTRGGKSATSGQADVTVKFADPVVAAHGPDCEEGCVNAEVYALFNVAMDPTTFAPERGNVELLKCRDAACNAPFEPASQRRIAVTNVKDDAGAVRGLSISFIPDAKGAELEPASYYLVRLRGGQDGIRSASGVALSGLNDGQHYTWDFHTKNSSTPCTVSRATVSPSQLNMSYVGERAEFRVVPFGAPDQCDVRGQALRGEAYNWRWDNQGGFVAGYVDPLVYPQFGQSRLDTAPTGVLGCTDRCTLAGSQNVIAQCGNGRVENGEECDGGTGCTNRCLNAGTRAPACGNGTIGPGESCEKVGGAFPPGCKDPNVDVPGRVELNGVGCVLLGSSEAAKARCGDGRVTDGESCDDGNAANGDGCSRQCLREGTLRSCLDAGAGEPCVNFCGNGRAEPGEDPVCETAAGPAAAGCNPVSCVRAGTPACGVGSKGACCGNGVAETGEEPSCETGNGVAAFCTNRCVLAGSSSAYSTPSFCRDGVVGLGEALACDGGVVTRDGKNDPRQAIEAGLPQDQNATTTLVASLPEISREENKGKATVSLSCTCSEQTDPQAFCAAIGNAKSPAVALGCANSGCCALAPRVQDVRPADGSQAQCRNAEISIVFDAAIDPATMEGGVLVGEAVTGATCAAGRQALPPLAYDAPRPGFFARVWQSVSGFFRNLISSEASAEPLPDPKTTSYCVVPGTFSLNGRVATFVPQDAMKPNTWYRVFVNGDLVEGTTSVPIGVDYNSHFRTGPDLCRVGSVTVAPTTHLFTIGEDLGTNTPADLADGDHAFVAKAHPERDPSATVVSTPAYIFNWRWDRAVQDDQTVVTVTPSPAQGGQGDQDRALVAVRRGEDGFPKNGASPVRVSAQLPADDEIAARSISASANAVVMLCQQPWPARRTCGANRRPFPELPWDRNATCDVPGETVWYPFYDPATNVEFYYCRDGQEAGDVGDTLPALREDVVRVQPGRDILFEYLFTFDQSSSGAWSNDAVGLRVAKNLDHQPIAEWYRAQGFRGNPSSTVVGGRPALAEGRTIYIDGVTRAGAGVYTNVNIFSHSDNAAPETIAVFGRVLENVDLSRNLRDFGYCVNAEGKQQLDSRDQPIACRADASCVVLDEKGAITPESAGATCLAMESKLVRDVQRWQDLHGIRARILSRGSGNFPKLDAGTYLRSQTTSRWPSWEETLGDELGGELPDDPVNAFIGCPDGADPSTCFNEARTQYQCPAGSHVYEYQSIGGVDFRLRNDFETACAAIATQAACEALAGVDATGRPDPFCAWDKNNGCQPLASFAGTTCIEQREEKLCTETAGCSWNGSTCNYAVGQLDLGGISAGPICVGQTVGEGGVCGDGIVQGKEECEPGGPSDVQQCQNKETERLGTQARSCRNDCTYGEFGACTSGACGDGIVQLPEVCDDGELNGTYGFCDSTCKGQGFRCGDGVRQPTEACDCGTKNGSYAFNGALDAANSCRTTGASAPSCSFDCSAPAPRCGDGAVNGTEQCDGGFQESVGYCGLGSSSATFGQACSTDAQCGGAAGSCVTCATPEQRMRRTCNPNDPSKTSDDAKSCTYTGWTCTAPGTCGDGVKNTGEECDDGNTNNNDGCVIDPASGYQCRLARCGDGYRDAGAGEQCDDGARNGVPCVPGYGQSCQSCTTSCRTVANSGGFCGDGRVQSPGASFCSISGAACSASTPCAASAGTCQVQTGPEQCEGNVGLLPNYVCVSTVPIDRQLGKSVNASCQTASCTQGCGNGATMCFNDPTDGVPNFDGDALTDACDPDRDNDKVPLDLDCNDFDVAQHGAYLDIAAATEICGDNKDNDCDGQIDNASVVTGVVRDLVTGSGVGNATVKVMCGNLLIGQGVTQSGFSSTGAPGKYSVVVPNTGTCPNNKFDVIAEKPTAAGGAYCTNPYLATQANVPLGACGSSTADLFLMPQPPVGAKRIDFSWTARTGLDYELRFLTDQSSGDQSQNNTVSTRQVNTGLASRRVTQQSLIVLAPAQRIKYFLRTTSSSANAKGAGITMRVWDNGCNVTTVTGDDSTGPSPARHWDAFTTAVTGENTVNNVFTANAPPAPVTP